LEVALDAGGGHALGQRDETNAGQQTQP
jgi:hypothetical protein